MLFKQIAGQEKIKNLLIKSAKDSRISHAQLFLGQEGCGNLALAIAFAQYINCTNKLENDSCGQCNSCLKYNKLIHPDLHFVYPVASTKDISKNPVSDDFLQNWREVILENPYLNLNTWYETIGMENKQGNIGKDESVNIIKKLSLKTYEGDYKIMIIWMAEKMNDSCANKILKILEEPPENTLFLLIVESTELLLPTILSRTQILKIPKLSEKEIIDYLVKKYKKDADSIEKAAHLSNGNLARAIKLIEIDQKDTENHERFVELMRISFKKNIFEIMQWIDNMSTLGREGLKRFFEYALRMTRENYLMNLKLEKIIYMDNVEADFSKKFHVFIKTGNIKQIADEFTKASTHIECNAYNKIVLLDMALKLFGLINPQKNN